MQYSAFYTWPSLDRASFHSGGAVRTKTVLKSWRGAKARWGRKRAGNAFLAAVSSSGSNEERKKRPELKEQNTYQAQALLKKPWAKRKWIWTNTKSPWCWKTQGFFFSRLTKHTILFGLYTRNSFVFGWPLGNSSERRICAGAFVVGCIVSKRQMWTENPELLLR